MQSALAAAVVVGHLFLPAQVEIKDPILPEAGTLTILDFPDAEPAPAETGGPAPTDEALAAPQAQQPPPAMMRQRGMGPPPMMQAPPMMGQPPLPGPSPLGHPLYLAMGMPPWAVGAAPLVIDQSRDSISPGEAALLQRTYPGYFIGPMGLPYAVPMDVPPNWNPGW